MSILIGLTAIGFINVMNLRYKYKQYGMLDGHDILSLIIVVVSCLCILV